MSDDLIAEITADLAEFKEFPNCRTDIFVKLVDDLERARDELVRQAQHIENAEGIASAALADRDMYMERLAAANAANYRKQWYDEKQKRLALQTEVAMLKARIEDDDKCIQRRIAELGEANAKLAEAGRVLREPTQAMEKAGWSAVMHHTNGTNHLLAGGLCAAWIAMYDAAIAADPSRSKT